MNDLEKQVFATILSDDTPGYRETMYGPSFYTEEEAKTYCNDFNNKNIKNNWCALVGKPGSIKRWHGYDDISPECPLPEKNLDKLA